MPADFEKYRPFVDHFDLTESGKQELVNHVWAMMENSIDRALHSDPSQRAIADASWGVDENVAKRALKSSTVVDLTKDEYQTHGLTKIFKMDINRKKGVK